MDPKLGDFERPPWETTMADQWETTINKPLSPNLNANVLLDGSSISYLFGDHLDVNFNTFVLNLGTSPL